MKSQIMEGMMRVFIAERGMVMFVCMFVGGLQIPQDKGILFCVIRFIIISPCFTFCTYKLNLGST